MAFLLCSPAEAAEPTVAAAQLPHIPPTSPEQAVATFRVKPGFRLELVAAEPDVVDPIALSFDEAGRLYVVEMRDYSERRPERLGRIRRLEDTNGDGRFDRSTVFAQALPWPTAVFCYGGGVFVGCTPEILWMRDITGDGHADEREVIFTGFAVDYAPFATNKLNVQALLNSFNWSLDNRIHGATSFSGGRIRRLDSPFVQDWRRQGGPPRGPMPAMTNAGANGTGQPSAPLTAANGSGAVRAGDDRNHAADASPLAVDLRGRDFSFDPRTLELRPESGGGQHGLSFDDLGRKFVCANSSHVQTLLYEEHYAAASPSYPLPQALVEIAVDGGAAPVFRISPDEPWRVIRTQWRVAGLVPGPIEGGGRASGYFTGATGLTIYRGDAYGAEFVGDAFIGDAGGNLVHRKKIRPDGPGLDPGTATRVKAERPADEQNVEFLASTDNWFRPVQFANAPDGCLYLCDMYREVIEHPWSLPQSIKQHLDLNSGNDRGRIYRILPEQFSQPKRPPLTNVGTRELVAVLASPNGWHRDAAARLLYERQDSAAAPVLGQLIANAPLAQTRVQALYALAGLGRLEPADASRALADPAPAVRRHAVRLSERLLPAANSGNPAVGSNAVVQRLMAMAHDNDDYVREQLALTLRFLSREERVRTAAAMLASRPTDGDEAFMSSVGGEAWEVFQVLTKADPSLATPGIWKLARNVGVRPEPVQVAGVINAALAALEKRESDEPKPWPSLAIIASLAQGLDQGGRSLREFDREQRLAPLYALARQLATELPGSPDSPGVPKLNAAIPPIDRVRASLFILGGAPYEENAVVLMDMIERSPDWMTQAAAALGRHTDPRMAIDLLRRWPRLTPGARAEVMALLTRRTERVQALLTALEGESVRASDLTTPQQLALREHRDLRVRERANKVLGNSAKASRQSAVDSFAPALQILGSAGAGRKAFLARCATCHRAGSEGHPVGPDLATVRNGGREKLLSNIVDPNREMNANFMGYAIETRDGESLTGIIAGENASSVTLRMPGGLELVIARNRIASLESQGRSLMPEGLEEGLTPQDMADLLEFIMAGP